MNAAAIAVPDTQLSIIRSTNVMIVHDKLDTTSGAATRSTSRPPLGRPHQERSPSVLGLLSVIAFVSVFESGFRLTTAS